jgi:hypothetical protein
MAVILNGKMIGRGADEMNAGILRTTGRVSAWGSAVFKE